MNINTIVILRGNEYYIFSYDDVSTAECLRMLGRFASNPDLSFTWYDAAVLSKKIRQEATKHAAAEECPRRFNMPKND